jgi:Domain of unknown function (DUF4124)
MTIRFLFHPSQRDQDERTARRLRWVVPVQLLWAFVLPAFAATPQTQVFRCEDVDGHVVFSDTMCGTNAEKVDVVESSGGLSAIKGDGLSSDERSILSQAGAREAQRATPTPSAGSAGSAARSAPSPNPVARPPSVSRHRSY